jgi:hypothetical protein
MTEFKALQVFVFSIELRSPLLILLGPMRKHSRWTTGIDLLPNQLARSL